MSDTEDSAIVAIISAHSADVSPYMRIPHLLDLFPARRQAVEFIKQFYEANGQMPKAKTVKDKFPSIDTLRRPEPLPHCFEELKGVYIETVCAKAGDEMVKGLTGKSYKDVLKHARALTDLVAQADAGIGSLPLESKHAIKELADRIDRDGAAALKVMPTGLKPFDDMDGGGVRPGHLYTIASLVNLGKTYISLRIAEGIRRAGFKVGFFSLEMPSHDIHMRLLSVRYALNADCLVSPAQPESSIKAGEAYEVWFKSTLQLTQSQIDADKCTGEVYVIGSDAGMIDTAMIRMEVERNKLEMVIIDAAQDLRDSKGTKERTPMLYNAVWEMNTIANQNHVGVLFTVQMDPEVERKGLNKGNLTRIAWGQVFAQKSDIVITVLGDRESLHRDVKVEKARNGRVGRNFWVTMNFTPVKIEATTKPPGTLEDLDKEIAVASSISELDQMLQAVKDDPASPTTAVKNGPGVMPQRAATNTLPTPWKSKAPPPPRSAPHLSQPGAAPEPSGDDLKVSPYELRRLHKSLKPKARIAR